MQSEIKLSVSLERFFSKIFCRLFILLGALLFLQFPSFLNHYKTNLKGRVEELSLYVKSIENAARISNKTIDEYIHKFEINEDLDFSLQGKIMSQTFMRFKALTYALFSLENSTVFTRPFMFFYTLKGDVLLSSFQSYQISLTLTYESIAYAILGILFGYGCFLVLRKGVFLFKKSKYLT